MRRITDRNEMKEDYTRSQSGFYALGEYDLTLKEVVCIMHEFGLTDINDFIKNRAVYINMCLSKLEVTYGS